ncbi:hypothetical protein LJC57_07480 [Parabacteroides sp. OttesenSCG-928-G07]|nr:hypothetical protein [Parabacteroides sp. OttesenSCG-928-G21]MDL2278417.1 hypothetical protein [Parabacteroides sp. OttesenSCG-928-G07]
MLTTLFVTTIILVICMVLLSIKVLFKKGGKFPNTHVGGNKGLRDKGITCAKTQHREALMQQNLFERINKKD